MAAQPPSTPLRAQDSSEAEFLTPATHISSASIDSYLASALSTGISHEKAIVIDDDDVEAPSREPKYLTTDDDEEEQRTIPPPPTQNNNGNLLEWDSKEDIYEYL